MINSLHNAKWQEQATKKVSEFSETFFVACFLCEKWARRYSDKVFALPTEDFPLSELE